MGKRLFGLMLALVAAFCITGGMVLTAFAETQQSDGQDMIVGSTELTSQTEGDVAYVERSWDANNKKVIAEIKTKALAEYTVLSDQTSWGVLSDQTSWGGAADTETWLVLRSSKTIYERITVSGTVNLILCDGATLTACKGITVKFVDGNNDGKSDNVLNIYAQEGGTGILLAGSAGENGIAGRNAGIGADSSNSDCGTLNIHGGDVTAIGGRLAAGIGGGYHRDGGTVNVYGGAATATGAYEGELTATFKIVGPAKTEAATEMTDLKVDAWYLGGDGSDGGYFPGTKTLYMDYTLAKGLMSGYKDKVTGEITGFGPEDELSRAQGAVIVYRMAHDDISATTEPDKYEVNTSGMTDVADRQYYTAAVNWAVENGVITGYTDPAGNPLHKFGPDDPISREQLATIIARYMDPEGTAGSDVSMFNDRDSISG